MEQEKIVKWSKEEVKEMLERKYNLEIQELTLSRHGAKAVIK